MSGEIVPLQHRTRIFRQRLQLTRYRLPSYGCLSGQHWGSVHTGTIFREEWSEGGSLSPLYGCVETRAGRTDGMYIFLLPQIVDEKIDQRQYQKALCLFDRRRDGLCGRQIQTITRHNDNVQHRPSIFTCQPPIKNTYSVWLDEERVEIFCTYHIYIVLSTGTV